jgi:hypothetical protein
MLEEMPSDSAFVDFIPDSTSTVPQLQDCLRPDVALLDEYTFRNPT